MTPHQQSCLDKIHACMPCSTKSMAERTGINQSYLSNLLSMTKGAWHISDWEMTGGQPRAVYASGAGADVPIKVQETKEAARNRLRARIKRAAAPAPPPKEVAVKMNLVEALSKIKFKSVVIPAFWPFKKRK